LRGDTEFFAGLVDRLVVAAIDVYGGQASEFRE
jgi:hypothetical protein